MSDNPEDNSTALVKKEAPLYMLSIQEGNVFEGTLNQFESKFFTFPAGLDDEAKIKVIDSWVRDQGWLFDCHLVH